MGEERIELEKLNIVLFQSLAVLFSAYIVSLFLRMQNTRRRQLPFSISCILYPFTLAILPIVFIAEAI